MTTRAKKTKLRKGARTKSPNPKHAVLAAALVHVPFDGFTDAALARAAEVTGVSRVELARLFPQGPISLIELFSEWADAEMVCTLAEHNLASLKIRERIALAVKTRIAVLQPHKEAARRAAAFLSLPPHAAVGIRLLYRTVDVIWRATGDTSTDFNFYTKRAILGAVYSSTLLRWFSDSSADESETEDFLRHRIEDVMRFEKFKAQVRDRASALPSLSDIFNPNRRGATPGRPKAKGA